MRAGAGSVVLVEPAAKRRRALARALRADGLTVATAPDGRAALALLARGRPALLVLDAALPGVAVPVLAAAARAAYGPDLPLLALAEEGTVALAERLRARAVLRKPVRPAALRAAARAALDEA